MIEQQITKYFPVVLFIYHLLFAYVAWNYILQDHGDASRYWFVGQDLSQKSWFSFFQPGTDIVKMITFPLVKYLHLPFWSGFILFSLFSFIGFYRLWKLILMISFQSKIAFFVGIILLLLPNLHLWTSFIGKESIIFVAIVLMTEKLLDKKMTSPVFILAFLIVAIIRPHVAIVLLVSFVIAYFWKGKLTWKNKAYFGAISTMSFLGIYYLLKKIAFIAGNPFERIAHIYDYHIKGLKKTTAYVPLDEYSLPYKIFTFYYRPLPLERSGIFYEIWSLENLTLLLLCIIVFFIIVKNFKATKCGIFDIFAIFAVLLLAFMYVYGYANYGLIARTKIMAMPFIYVLMVKILSQKVEIVARQDAQKETSS